MRPGSSLPALIRRPTALLCGACALAAGVGCGGSAAQPTTAPAQVAPTVAVVASPQRPALASPVPSSVGLGASPVPSTSPGSGQTYEVQSGDTLLSVAEQFYGDTTKWRSIYDANKDVIGDNPDALKIGMKLKIPPKES